MTRNPIYITWLNHLGGFEYHLFTGYSDHQINIIESQVTKQNIFLGWPNSYNYLADTIEKKIYTKARKQIVLRSQPLNVIQAEALAEIRTSPIVQILVSRLDKRTVLVDNESVVIYKESDKLHYTSFTITYTDEIPSQHA